MLLPEHVDCTGLGVDVIVTLGTVSNAVEFSITYLTLPESKTCCCIAYVGLPTSVDDLKFVLLSLHLFSV